MIFSPLPCSDHQKHFARLNELHIGSTIDEWPDIRVAESVLFEKLIGDLDQFFSIILKRNINKRAAFAKALEVFVGFEDLYTIHRVVRTDAFEYTKSVVQRLAIQVSVRIHCFDELPIEVEDRVLCVIHDYKC